MKATRVGVSPNGIELHSKTIQHDWLVIGSEVDMGPLFAGTPAGELFARIESVLSWLTEDRVRRNIRSPEPELAIEDETADYVIPSMPRRGLPSKSR